MSQAKGLSMCCKACKTQQDFSGKNFEVFSLEKISFGPFSHAKTTFRSKLSYI